MATKPSICGEEGNGARGGGAGREVSLGAGEDDETAIPMLDRLFCGGADDDAFLVDEVERQVLPRARLHQIEPQAASALERMIGFARTGLAHENAVAGADMMNRARPALRFSVLLMLLHSHPYRVRVERASRDLAAVLFSLVEYVMYIHPIALLPIDPASRAVVPQRRTLNPIVMADIATLHVATRRRRNFATFTGATSFRLLDTPIRHILVRMVAASKHAARQQRDASFRPAEWHLNADLDDDDDD